MPPSTASARVPDRTRERATDGPVVSQDDLEAAPAVFRTEPLMGLRFKSAFLHDGRATTVEQAIDFHGGEAQASRDRFDALPVGERAAIVRFLREL